MAGTGTTTTSVRPTGGVTLASVNPDNPAQAVAQGSGPVLGDGDETTWVEWDANVNQGTYARHAGTFDTTVVADWTAVTALRIRIRHLTPAAAVSPDEMVVLSNEGFDPAIFSLTPAGVPTTDTYAQNLHSRSATSWRDLLGATHLTISARYIQGRPHPPARVRVYDMWVEVDTPAAAVAGRRRVATGTTRRYPRDRPGRRHPGPRTGRTFPAHR